MTHDAPAPPVVLDRRTGRYGEVVLRRHGELLQIIANGTFLMDTSGGTSERLLVRAALSALPPERTAPSVLIGGLGVGFSLAEAAAEPRWGHITVVEREPAVIDWHRPGGPLSPLSADALRDARTEVVRADLAAYLRGDQPGAAHGELGTAAQPVPDTAPHRAFDALCLDVDNGPGWTVTDDNGSLYTPDGLAGCAARLTPGGVLAVWSAQPSPGFETTLRNAGFRNVRTEEVTVARGVPDLVHLATKPA
jgi:spermidine synthase